MRAILPLGRPVRRRWNAAITTLAVAVGVFAATPASAITSPADPATASLTDTAPALSDPSVTTSGTVSAPATESGLETLTVSRETHTAARSAIRPAADLSQFRAGNIISDAVFTASGTMNAASIDAFLREKAPSCQSGYTCMKDFRQSTPTRPADSYCSGYSGAANESAATIIAKVSQSCGLNPQVFLVMLQKEQGLVTHTWPSQWRYDMALGQGCPDDAPCDPQFAGFFYQIYGAGRQMKIYMEGRHFTWFAPGKTWDILYNPNRACGSGPVRIENAATAALYYYTPYQPNRAALSAGYGTGDSCSAYGNRNFYQYFVDWFGSTQTPGSTAGASGLLQGSGRSEVYLVSGGVKHHVAAWEDYVVLRSRLGNARIVPAGQIDALPTGGTATRYVHDPRSGTLYLLESDGSKHRFVSSAQINAFGYPFSSYVNLEAGLVDRFRTGSDVTGFFRIGSSPDVYALANGKRRYVTTTKAWVDISRGTSGYISTMSASAGQRLPLGPAVLTPHMLVRESSSKTLYLTLASGALLRVPGASLAAEYGARTTAVVPNRTLSATTVRKGTLTPVVVCSRTPITAAGGVIYRVDGAKYGGTNRVHLSGEDCQRFPWTNNRLSDPLFVQPAGSSAVYLLHNGAFRHVRTYERLMQLNGNRPLRVLSWSSAAVKAAGVRGPLLPERVFVQFQGKPEVYLHRSGSVLNHVRTYDTLVQLGGGRVPPIEILPASYLSTYRIGAPILRHRELARFDGTEGLFRFDEDGNAVLVPEEENTEGVEPEVLEGTPPTTEVPDEETTPVEEDAADQETVPEDDPEGTADDELEDRDIPDDELEEDGDLNDTGDEEQG